MSSIPVQPDMPSVLGRLAVGIDHIAIAVPDLERSVTWFTSVLGFVLKERRVTEGATTGMLSAVIEAGPLSLVLLQGTSPQSQVSKYIQKYGPGVHHLAVGVENIRLLTDDLQASGFHFDTSLLEGDGLRQIFSKRDEGSGLMIEFIERSAAGFSDQNATDLFKQLETSGSF